MQFQLIIDFLKNLIRPTPTVAENFVALLVAQEEKLVAEEPAETVEEEKPAPKKRVRKKKLEE